MDEHPDVATIEKIVSVIFAPSERRQISSLLDSIVAQTQRETREACAKEAVAASMSQEGDASWEYRAACASIMDGINERPQP